jgi:hypothetical protein
MARLAIVFAPGAAMLRMMHHKDHPACMRANVQSQAGETASLQAVVDDRSPQGSTQVVRLARMLSTQWEL